MWLTTVDFCDTRCYSRTLLRVARVCLLPTLSQVKRTETVRVARERAEPGMSGVGRSLPAQQCASPEHRAYRAQPHRSRQIRQQTPSHRRPARRSSGTDCHRFQSARLGCPRRLGRCNTRSAWFVCPAAVVRLYSFENVKLQIGWISPFLAKSRRAMKDIALGGPGGIRTHGGISPADYESAACNQHSVRPCSDARDSTLKFPEFATIASRDGLI